MRRFALFCLLLALPILPAAGQVAVPAGRIIDLTHTISESSPVFFPTMKFRAELDKMETERGIYSRTFCASEHLGTHVDAPDHFGGPKQAAVDQLSLRQLIVPAIVVDVTGHVKSFPDYQLAVADLDAWEARYGTIPPGSMVIARTGWGTRWEQGEPYRNADAKGVMHFPGFSVDAGRRLVERRVAGLAIDTLSVDYGPSTDFAVHFTTQPRGLYHIENLAATELLPAKGAVLVVSPLKLQGGSGSPARVWAILP